jgi:hypothetical protein
MASIMPTETGYYWAKDKWLYKPMVVYIDTEEEGATPENPVVFIPGSETEYSLDSFTWFSEKLPIPKETLHERQSASVSTQG